MNVRRTGRGKAVMMNMMLNGYQAILLTGVGGERATQISGAEEFCGNLRRLIGGLLTGSDVRSRCKVTLAGNNRDYPCQTMLRNIGNNYIFGLLEFTEDGNTFDMNRGENVVVKLPVKGHIYNVRERKYLGSGDEIRLKLVPAWGYLYAVLQDRITGVEIDAPATVRPGNGIKIAFRAVAEKGVPGAQTFHISLIRPDGKSPAMYRSNVFSDTGKGEISLQTACNDPAGKWTLRVVNVNSGTAAEKAIVLQ